MKIKSLATTGLLILSLLLTFTLSSPAHALDARSQVTQSTETTTPKLASQPRSVERATPGEEKRYAAREAASPGAKEHRGGDTVVIGASALAVVLLVVVVLILI